MTHPAFVDETTTRLRSARARGRRSCLRYAARERKKYGETNVFGRLSRLVRTNTLDRRGARDEGKRKNGRQSGTICMDVRNGIRPAVYLHTRPIGLFSGAYSFRPPDAVNRETIDTPRGTSRRPHR